MKVNIKTKSELKRVKFVFVGDSEKDKGIKKENDVLEVKISTDGITDKRVLIRRARRAVRKAVSLAKSHKEYKISIYLSDFGPLDFDEALVLKELALEAKLANYTFDKYKSKKDKKLEMIDIVVDKVSDKLANALKESEIISKYIEYSRNLANTPGGEMTPSVLANEAKKLSKLSKNLKVKILDEKELKKMGAGALLAVGSGSKHKPKLITLEYRGNKSKKNFDLVLVGKGITFDTGGLGLKPAEHMLDMHHDMTGAGSVIAMAGLVAELDLKVNIAFLAPAAENAIGSESYRPGDILKTICGKTVEVGHTDAEGRLILADAICYAKKYKAPLLIDIATLTGAALVALGQEAHAIMSNNEDFAFAVREWSEEVGDYAWPLPLWEEYANIMKGTFADLNNIQNKGPERYGGTVTAGAFLYEFAKESADTFLHIDMAPRMTPGPNDNLPKNSGSLGGPIRLVLEIIKRRV